MQVVSYLGAARPAFSRCAAGAPAGTWCTNPRKPLFLRSHCTKSRARFGVWPAGTWCTNSRKALFFRSLCTKPRARFGAWAAGTWRTNSRKALFFRPLCTKSRACFGVWPAGTWCTNPRKPLFFRSHCTKSRAHFGPRRALFAVMLFINLQKRYNEMARLARGRFGRRKGTRSKQFITGGIMIGERTCLTKSLV